MKRFIIDLKIVIVSLIVLLGSQSSHAQIINQKDRKWFVPDHVVLQYAGSIGYMSGGVGYNLFKKKANLDFLYGYVPRFTGSKAISSLTLKFNALPIRIVLNETTTFYPLTTGAYFCYTFGQEYNSRLPAWYPDGYYWWSEAVRANIFIGSSINFTLRGMKPANFITGYYELGTNEIKLVSYVQNLHELHIWNIVHAAVGFRYHF